MNEVSLLNRASRVRLALNTALEELDDNEGDPRTCIEYALGQLQRMNTRENILNLIVLELRQNLKKLEGLNLPSQGNRHPEYYDPTRQLFKFRDDALTYVLSTPTAFSQIGPSLVNAFLLVSEHVRFVNMQIDELLAFRFGNPIMLAEARAYAYGEGKKFPPADENKIRRKFRAWFRELALRHWAIVNEGLYKRLSRSVPYAIHLCDEAIKSTNR